MDRTNMELLHNVKQELKSYEAHTVNMYQVKVAELSEALLDIQHSQLPSLEERQMVTEAITEHHFEIVGKFPKGAVLSSLADFIMLHYIKDLSKSKFDDNVFHSEHQTKRRLSKEYSTQEDTMDYLNSKMNLKLDSLSKKTSKQVD